MSDLIHYFTDIHNVNPFLYVPFIILPYMEPLNDFTIVPLFPISVCMMVGIVVGCYWEPWLPMPYVLLVTVAAAYACRQAVSQTVAIFLCCVVFGMALVQLQGETRDGIEGRELQGVVMSEPANRPKTVCVDILTPSAGGRTLRCYLWKDRDGRVLRLGDAIVFRISPPRECSDNNAAGKWRGSMSQAPFYFVRSIDWHHGGIAHEQMSRWQRSRLWFLHQRHKLLERYRDFDADTDTYSVLAAMTLGDKSTQTAELREAFSVSGASHVLAISGLHVGIVYMLMTWLMLGRNYFWLSQVLSVSAVWAFAMLTGMSASVTRAATMISLYSVFAGRSAYNSPINVLCFTAIVMLIADAYTLFDASFQMSFLAVFAILTFMPLLQAVIKPDNTILRWMCNLCLMSFCAQIGVAPLTAYYFGRFSTYFLLANFIAIPAATFILYGSFLSLIFPPASTVLVWIVRLMNDGLRLIASLPGASIDDLHPTKTQILLTYVFIGLCYAIMRIVIPLNRINSMKNIRKRK